MCTVRTPALRLVYVEAKNCTIAWLTLDVVAQGSSRQFGRASQFALYKNDCALSRLNLMSDRTPGSVGVRYSAHLWGELGVMSTVRCIVRVRSFCRYIQQCYTIECIHPSNSMIIRKTTRKRQELVFDHCTPQKLNANKENYQERQELVFEQCTSQKLNVNKEN
ncbi:hypothetical protein J6590_064542 [Homalodisca vitripennis]|nr:hypothetical protein J6590_064542 [Homalodisca vitripennis]